MNRTLHHGGPDSQQATTSPSPTQKRPGPASNDPLRISNRKAPERPPIADPLCALARRPGRPTTTASRPGIRVGDATRTTTKLSKIATGQPPRLPNRQGINSTRWNSSPVYSALAAPLHVDQREIYQPLATLSKGVLGSAHLIPSSPPRQSTLYRACSQVQPGHSAHSLPPPDEAQMERFGPSGASPRAPRSGEHDMTKVP